MNRKTCIIVFGPKINKSVSVCAPLLCILCLSTSARLLTSLCLLLGIFVQQIFETNLNFRYQRVSNQKKINALLLYQLLKLTSEKCLYFFRSFTHLQVKSRFPSNTFWTKIHKSSHSDITWLDLSLSLPSL